MSAAASESVQIINETYDEMYCAALQLAYGEHLLAEGGPEGIDFLIQGIDFHNQKILDFGSGLGGVAFHLARHHGAHVVGVDINARMIQRARDNIPEDVKDKVEFCLIRDGESLPFVDESFDIVFSKGVMVHLALEQKQVILKDFFRILKKGGVLVIGDWMAPQDEVWSARMQRLIDGEGLPLFAISPQTYKKLALDAGFTDVAFSDRSLKAVEYNLHAAERLLHEPIRSQFIRQFGADELAIHVEGYKNIAASNESGELITGTLTAFKE